MMKRIKINTDSWYPMHSFETVDDDAEGTELVEVSAEQIALWRITEMKFEEMQKGLDVFATKIAKKHEEIHKVHKLKEIQTEMDKELGDENTGTVEIKRGNL